MNFDDLIYASLACIGLGIFLYIAMTLKNIEDILQELNIKHRRRLK